MGTILWDIFYALFSVQLVDIATSCYKEVFALKKLDPSDSDDYIDSEMYETMYKKAIETDSDIVEYSLLPPEVQGNVAFDENANDINVNNVEVPTNVVENALQNVVTTEESIPAVPVDEVASEEVASNGEVPVEESVPEVPVDEVAPEEVVSNVEVPVEESVSEVPVDEVAPEEVVSNVEVPVEESIPEVAVDEVVPEEVTSDAEVPVEESMLMYQMIM